MNDGGDSCDQGIEFEISSTPETNSDSESQIDTDPESETDTDPESETDTEPESETDTDSESDIDTDCNSDDIKEQDEVSISPSEMLDVYKEDQEDTEVTGFTTIAVDLKKVDAKTENQLELKKSLELLLPKYIGNSKKRQKGINRPHT